MFLRAFLPGRGLASAIRTAFNALCIPSLSMPSSVVVLAALVGNVVQSAFPSFGRTSFFCTPPLTLSLALSFGYHMLLVDIILLGLANSGEKCLQFTVYSDQQCILGITDIQRPITRLKSI